MESDSCLLGNAYREAYIELLGYLANQLDEEIKLTYFWPMRGRNYRNGLMIVGRAVNGWVVNSTVYALKSDVKSFVDKSQGYSEGNRMDWLREEIHTMPTKEKKWKVYKSQFWRTIRKVIDIRRNSEHQDVHWRDYDGWSTIYWTNLYKVSPTMDPQDKESQVKSGNPSGKLREYQQTGNRSAAVLRMEIGKLDPEAIVVLAGEEFFGDPGNPPSGSFAEYFGIDVLESKKVESRTYGVIWGKDREGRHWILAPHPRGKKEKEIAKITAEFLAPR
jgi:hypothetical protein